MSHTRRDRILDLVARLPAEAGRRRVLDVGCADGRLGALIKAQGNWVAGIELSEAGIAEAQSRLDAVWSFDIERPWPSQATAEPFDLIVIAEVLEHVFDPVLVLRSAHAALKPGGSVIITTPNFMTWQNRLRFLIGDFEYQSEGMFDFGHIRWFTYRYLNEVLHQAGFQVTKERHIIFPGKLTSILKQWPALFARQFVVKAIRQ